MRRAAAMLRDPLLWCLAALLYLVFAMPTLRPVFAALFPDLDRPIFVETSFADLTLAHCELVAVSSLISIAIGMATGLFVTHARGRAFRPLAETLVAMGQTMPPVAVLAVATPLIGFGTEPALIALALYGILPVAQNTMAGIDSVSASVRDSARGLGLAPTIFCSTSICRWPCPSFWRACGPPWSSISGLRP